jgi:hypothetical protein
VSGTFCHLSLGPRRPLAASDFVSI